MKANERKKRKESKEGEVSAQTARRYYYKYINAETRIPQPVIRTDAEAPHRPSTWEPALASAAEAVKRIAPNQLAIIASGRMTNEELYMVRHLAAQIGTDGLLLRKGKKNYCRLILKA